MYQFVIFVKGYCSNPVQYFNYLFSSIVSGMSTVQFPSPKR